MATERQFQDLDFGETQQQQLRFIVQHMADFMVLYEAAEDKLATREQQLHTRFTEYEHRMTEYLSAVQASIREFNDVLTQAGIARWRLAAETALRDGKTQAKKIEEATETFRQLSTDTCERLDRATSYTVKNISEAVGTFRVSDFKLLTEDCAKQVEKTAQSAVKQIGKVSRWFYWRKLLLVFSFTIILTVISGLYINDEWPWEMHNQVLTERQVGVATLQTWPQLSQADRDIILNQEKKHFT